MATTCREPCSPHLAISRFPVHGSSPERKEENGKMRREGDETSFARFPAIATAFARAA